MAELTPSERLQPSLLDRLTDREPGKKAEPRDRSVMSMAEIRRAVMRDLEWLLSTPNFASSRDLEDFPRVGASVVNFGISDLVGLAADGIDTRIIERDLRQAILNFEPRILAKSLKVGVEIRDDQGRRNALRIHIDGELWATPVPLSLYVETSIDLATGDMTVSDGSR